jgi:uncharacterized integral membrane protein
MRKKIFLGTAIFFIVLVLILGFENITTSQSFLLLFYSLELSTTLIVFFSAFLGFLIGFFAMLYSYEKGRELILEEEEGSVASAPATAAERSDKPVAVEPKADKFDEDDEILE